MGGGAGAPYSGTVARIPALDGLVGLLRTQTSALAALPATVSALAGAVRSLVEVVGEARQTLAAVHRAAVRVDALAAQLEEPVRALVPGLRRVATVLDDPAVSDLPATLRTVQDDLLPVLRTIADTHERVAVLSGSTERIMTFVEETSRTFSGLPGAGLLGRRRPPGRVVDAEPLGAEPRRPQPPTTR